MVRHVTAMHAMVMHAMIRYFGVMHVMVWCLRVRNVREMHVWADMSGHHFLIPWWHSSWLVVDRLGY
jgi:hypothetical protein